MAQPLISVITPCFNQGRFLKGAVESVLGQSYRNREVIIVNDGSTDDTERIAKPFANEVVYVKKHNAGLSAARNSGILAAKGDYLVFMDADDLLEPSMLEEMATVAVGNPGADVLVGGWRNLIDGVLDDDVSFIPLPADLFHGIMARNIGVVHCFMVKRTALANSGLFDVNLRSAEDWDMWIRLAAAGCRFVGAPKAVAIYRRSPDSMTADYNRMMRSTEALLRKNSLIHSKCRRCRRAVKAGWRAHFDCFVVPGAFRELKKVMRQDSALRSATKALQLCVAYPPLFGVILRTVLQKLSRGHWQNLLK